MSITVTGEASSASPASFAPSLADGVELIGKVQNSGFREPPYLARRADGQTIQLTEMLYQVLEGVDGQRDLEAIAVELSRKVGKEASPEDVGFLLNKKIAPLGLLKNADGSDPQVEKANPLLALRLKFVLSNEDVTRKITAPFAKLFFPLLVAAAVVGFTAVVGWVLFSEGIGGGARQAIYSPGFLLLTFALVAASAGFHEFGHAAACRYGGATPGAMGAGIYMVWPAFYTDVTDSYRLSRAGRLRTDLGGLYFNMVFAIGVFGVWALSGVDALLLVIPLLLMQMVQQLLPFVRLDGYHILADITGVPDLFARIKPTLVSLKPGEESDERVTALKPWVRVVITAWVIMVIPLLLASLAFAVFSFPRIAATAWDSLGLQWDGISQARSDGDIMAIAAGVLSILALCLPLLSTVYLVGRLASQGSKGLWNRTEDRPIARAGAGAVLMATAAVAAFVWWPNGEYRPLQEGERALLHETIGSVRDLPSGRPSLTEKEAEDLQGAPFRSDSAGDVSDAAETDTEEETVTDTTSLPQEQSGDDTDVTIAPETTTSTTEGSTDTSTATTEQQTATTEANTP